LNTLVQGAWGILLGRYSGREEVVFGTTVSGRPAEVSGIEEMVGMFINTLPVRMSLEGEPRVGRWLEEQQFRQVQARQYEYSPLMQVQGWSEIKRGEGLFETLLVFENYPVEKSVAEAGAERAKVVEVRVHERGNYPLTAIAVPGQRLQLQVRGNRNRYEAWLIDRVLEHLGRLLGRMAEEAERRISELSLLSAAEER